MKKTEEELKEKLNQDILNFHSLKDKLFPDEMLDEDGYPTDSALTLIENWHWSDPKGWFDFIKSIWWASDWGWSEKEEPHSWKENETVNNLYISTGGWSGNESIIRSMQKNQMLWFFNWVQSRRGGHYIFELK